MLNETLFPQLTRAHCVKGTFGFEHLTVATYEPRFPAFKGFREVWRVKGRVNYETFLVETLSKALTATIKKQAKRNDCKRA